MSISTQISCQCFILSLIIFSSISVIGYGTYILTQNDVVNEYKENEDCRDMFIICLSSFIFFIGLSLWFFIPLCGKLVFKILMGFNFLVSVYGLYVFGNKYSECHEYIENIDENFLLYYKINFVIQVLFVVGVIFYLIKCIVFSNWSFNCKNK